MLKQISIRGKKVPVPVPLKDLGMAIQWIEETLVRENSVVTSVKLDGEEVFFGESRERKVDLTADTELEVKIDSPRELSVQTLDAIRDLAFEVERGLKDIAVECWEKEGDRQIRALQDSAGDIRLMIELLEHVTGMLDRAHVEMAPVQGLARLIARAMGHLEKAIKNSDWKAAARLLLNRIEPLLKDLVTEAEVLQLNILTHAVDDRAGEVAMT